MEQGFNRRKGNDDSEVGRKVEKFPEFAIEKAWLDSGITQKGLDYQFEKIFEKKYLTIVFRPTSSTINYKTHH